MLYKIHKNSDEDFRKEVENAIKANDGYCCCAIEKCSDTKCMCKDFRDKLKDLAFEGSCDCGLYIKELINN